MVWIEIAGGLVGNEQRGLVDQRATDGNALLFAARKLVRKGVSTMRDLNLFEDCGHFSPHFALRVPDGAHGVGDVFPNSLVGKQRKILRDDAHLATKAEYRPIVIIADFLAIDPDLARGVSHLSGENFDEGALTRASTTDDKDELSTSNLQSYAVQSLDLTGVAYVYVPELNVRPVRH